MAEVELTRDDAVAVVTLKRPAKRNAMTLPMQRELIAALGHVAGDDAVRAVVLHGAGSDFCVGGDRAVMQQMAAEPGFADRAAAQHREVFALLFALEVPLFAAVEGAAFGFGAELAAACDVVIAGEGARLADPHVRFGLPPAPVTLLAWPAMTTRLVAVELAMTGREVPAPEAVTLGLASRVVPAGAALGEALASARAIAALPPQGVVAARRALRLRVEDLDRFYPASQRSA